MPRKHVNLKIGDQKFQLSVLDPFFHRSYNQAWTPTERAPTLTAGLDWKETDLPLELARALDQAVLACSSLSKKIAQGSYPLVNNIIVHVSRNDVTFMLELVDSTVKNDVLLQYSWDQNSQLIEPNNFNDLLKLGLSSACAKRLQTDLTQTSFGRLGLVARCLRLMAQKPYSKHRQQTVASNIQTA